MLCFAGHALMVRRCACCNAVRITCPIAAALQLVRSRRRSGCRAPPLMRMLPPCSPPSAEDCYSCMDGAGVARCTPRGTPLPAAEALLLVRSRRRFSCCAPPPMHVLALAFLTARPPHRLASVAAPWLRSGCARWPACRRHIPFQRQRRLLAWLRHLRSVVVVFVLAIWWARNVLRQPAV